MNISPVWPQHGLQKAIHSLYSQVWYWGPLTTNQDKVLEKKEDGAFLVRDSSDNKYLYSLSFRLGLGTVRHACIKQLCNGFSLCEPDGVYESVEELLEQAMAKSRQDNHDFLRRPARPSSRIRVYQATASRIKIQPILFSIQCVTRMHVRSQKTLLLIKVITLLRIRCENF